ADAGEDAKACALAWELEELRVPAAELVATARIAGNDVGLTHRERRAAGAHGAEASALRLRLLVQLEVDLDFEHLLHAAHVGPPPGLVGVHERALHPDAPARVDDLVAVDCTVATFDLVLHPQG